MKKESFYAEYAYDSAGRKMTREFLTAGKNDTLANVLHRLEKQIKDAKITEYVYVVDDKDYLVGVATIKKILSSPKNLKMSSIIKRNLIQVSPQTNREKAADLAVKHNINAIPVVENKKLVGVVSIDEILSTLNIALRRDILHLAGIHKSHLKYENTMEVPLFLSILHRLPWLIVGLIGITIAAIFIGIFEKILQNYLILAFFIPAIVYMSDALGTQHQTLFIRDLAIMGKGLNMKKYFFKQMTIGFILGLIISLIIFLIIFIFWKQTYIGFVISFSMFITLFLSSFTALIITLIINKLKLDPALGSGPLATIISDVTSIIIYFLVAMLFLRI